MSLINKIFQSKIYLCFNACLKRRNLCSALYVSGAKATEMFAALKPCLDFNFELISKSVKYRNTDVDMEKFMEVWNYYKTVEHNKTQLEINRLNIVKKLKEISNDNVTEIEHLKNLGRLIREDLKVVKEHLWSLEDNAIIQALNLPNILHERTPLRQDEVVHVFGSMPQGSSESHLEIGAKLNLVDYVNSQMYFLKGDAALLELGIMFYLNDIFSKANFVPFSNADFSRSVVVEGCGQKHRDPDNVFILENIDDTVPNPDSRLHLTGGASLVSFMAFHAKNAIYSSFLPLKYFTSGRYYEPKSEIYQSLFNVSQASTFDVFIATEESYEHNNQEFESVLKLVQNIYEQLGHHFRVVYRAAKNLHPWESLRVDFELYSPNENAYITVGYVAMCDNYPSKRLRMQVIDKKPRQYPKIISAKILHFPKYLGCLLEQSVETNGLIIPKCIKPYIP